jgi:hypothetical protein
MLLETIIALTQPTPEFSEPRTNPAIISTELRTNRNEFWIAQANIKATPKKKTQTIEIPEGYILCPKDYVCIPKAQYSGQPVVPSTVNQVPQSTITNPNPNQPPSQNINQINQNLNPGIGQINNQQNSIPGGNYPNQGINPSFGQPGGIGINNQQNIGIGSGGNYVGGYSGGSQPGKINTNINLGINMGVSW